MNTATPGLNRKPFKKLKPIKIIAICLVIALLAGGAYIFIRMKSSKTGAPAAQRTTMVVRGELTDSIAGSAPIVSSNRSELSPKVTATLEKINCKEGDQVKAGDVLFVIDNTDALLDIENSKNNIAQMQLTLDNTAMSVNGLVVKAPYSGQVTNISIKEGDTINKGGAIMTITDVSKLDVTLAFSGSEVKNISIGQTAVVYLQDLMLSVTGRVSYKSSKPYTTASGGELYNVEITIDNPGSLTEGMKATAEITAGGTTLESVQSGSLAYINNKVLRSDAGGTVTNLKVRENEFVNAGDVLMQLENDDLLLTSSTNDMKMENLKSQLNIQQKQLTYYTITAPFDGTITKMGTANEGDTVKQGEVLAVVSDMNHLEFSVDIDELDISKMAVGQLVDITSEALADTATTPLTGKVTKVAMEGSSSNGVTTYPVTITLDDDAASKLKTGMNIDAEIVIDSKSDVLMVPLEAVTKMGNRSFVYVKDAAGSQGSDGAGGQNSQSVGNMQGNQSARNSQNQNGNFRRRNTSGSAIGAYTGNTSGTGMRANRLQNGGNTSGGAINGNFPQGGGNTSGGGISGNWPQNGGSTSGGAIRGNRPQGGGNTSGGAIRGNWPQAGSTSQAAMQGSFARARGANSNSYYNGATMVEVQTGISNDSYIEITGGLSEGQVIVLPKQSTSTGTNSGANSTNRFQGGGGGMIGGGGFIGGGQGASVARRAN
jgi:HlyD family secretion protein